MALSLRYITSEKKNTEEKGKEEQRTKNINEKLHNYNYYKKRCINYSYY